MANMPAHDKRKHSDFSASGAERWFNCPGSVKLSQGLPDIVTPYALEGTQAHEVLETLLCLEFGGYDLNQIKEVHSTLKGKPHFMIKHARGLVEWVSKEVSKHDTPDVLIEEKVSLEFLQSGMFGTLDFGLMAFFDTLYILDYKFGAGHRVSPDKNLQLLFYALGLGKRYAWNFKRAKLLIAQPRVSGYDGPLSWCISTDHLLEYKTIFKNAVARVKRNPDEFVEGSWCHWCKARKICKLKTNMKTEKALSMFNGN